MKKEVVYGIFSYHFKKIILNKKEMKEHIKNLEHSYEKTNLKKLVTVLNEYKNNDDYLEIDEFIIKVLNKNFNISKIDVKEKISINGKLYHVFFEYLNQINNTNYSFDVLKKGQKDILTRLEVLDIEYELVIKRKTKTLQAIGDELGYTRERIRQKINDIKKILKKNKNILGLNYINYEDVKYLPKYKQAIIYSDDADNLDYVGMYVFDEKIKLLIESIVQKFKKLVLEEDFAVMEFVEKNYKILKRYVEYDPGFYMVQEELYTIYTKDKLDSKNYIYNYLAYANIYDFKLNKQFIDKLKNSIHGKLYEQKEEKKITQKLLKNLLESKNIIKMSADNYVYSVLIDNLKEEEILNKINENIPIDGKEEITSLFKGEIETSNLEVEQFYYYLKKIGLGHFEFGNFKIKHHNSN